MKALTVRQPWASLIAAGAKTLELRSRPVRYRGPVLICAGADRRVSADGREAIERLSIDVRSMPRGVAVAIAELVDCRPMRPADAGEACCPFEAGTLVYVLRDARRIEPFPVRGQLGLFNIDAGSIA